MYRHAEHVGVVGGLDLVRVEPAGEMILHESVKERDILRERRGKLLRGAVLIRRGKAPDKFAVVEGVAVLRARAGGEVQVLDVLPQPEKLRHGVDERRGLGAEHHRKLADVLSSAAVQLHLVLDGGAVFVLQRAFERHGKAVGREKRHQLARGPHQLVDGGENIVYPPLRRGVVHILREDLVDEVRAVGPHAVGQRVDLAHNLVVEHQAV